MPQTNKTGIKFSYKDETWTQNCCTYDPLVVEFLGRRRNTQFIENFPRILSLWNLFSPLTVLQDIVRKTNRYATAILDAMGSTMGGPDWVSLTTVGLKAFMSMTMYMVMKKQPNMKTYWKKQGSFFHCPTISNVMTSTRF